MARSTRKSVAGQEASAARKVDPRRSAKAETADAAAPTTKKAAPAKRAASAKKAPAVEKATARKQTAKKAVPATKARRAPLSSLVVKEGESPWTKSELAEVLTELGDQREHIAGIVAAQETELSGLMRDSGDGAGQDQADVGATSFERDHELTVLTMEREKLAQIDHALSRIDDGTYGVCESCGQPVGKMRLMAFPRATLCMTCKQREERH
jgi:RNA polymerase-binding protein DksA